MESLKGGRNMFFKFFFSTVFYFTLSINTVKAAQISCKVEKLTLSIEEAQEIYHKNSMRQLSDEQKLLISNFKFRNEATIENFKSKLEKIVQSEHGELNINSSGFIELLQKINDKNIISIMHMFGEDKYDRSTNFNFKNTNIKLRYKDLINTIIMVRYGEDLWVQAFPYPYWNIPFKISKVVNNIGLSSKKFSLPEYNSKVVKPMPRLFRGGELRLFGEYQYQKLAESYYDKNIYYTWKKEWHGTKNSENGEWNRNYEWLEKTINEYKGKNLSLMGKLNKAKDSLIGMCD